MVVLRYSGKEDGGALMVVVGGGGQGPDEGGHLLVVVIADSDHSDRIREKGMPRVGAGVVSPLWLTTTTVYRLSAGRPLWSVVAKCISTLHFLCANPDSSLGQPGLRR